MKKALSILLFLFLASTSWATVSIDDNRVQYNCDGVITTYIYAFQIYQDSDLVVTKAESDGTETTLVLNIDYSVTGAGDVAGGTVELTDGPTCPSTYTLTTLREIPLLQSLDLEDGQAFSAEDIERGFDKAMLIAQDESEKIGRALLHRVSSDLKDLNLPVPVPNNSLCWDETGTEIVNCETAGGGGSAVDSVNGETGTVVLSQDEVLDGGTFVQTHNDYTDLDKDASHTQGTDTDLGTLGTKDPPIDADKIIYRDSIDSNNLVTSTWTQVKAFLRTYFDTIYAAILGKEIYVTDYGGGTGFDNAAIVAAFAAAGDGDHIIFSVGDYTLTSAISTDKRVVISGNNNEITCTGTGSFTLSGARAIIRDVIMIGDRTTGTVAISITNNRIIAENIKIYLFDTLMSVTGGVWHHIENIRGRNAKTTAISVLNVVGTVVTDFRYDTDTGSYAQPTRGILLTGQGCNFSDVDIIHGGAALEIAGSAATAAGAIWNFFNSCSFDTSTYACTITSDDAASVVRGVMFDHCWFASSTEIGVVISGAYTLDGVTFNNCYIISNAKDGMSIEGVATNIDVNTCIFSGNTKDAVSTYSHIYTNSLGRKLIRNSFFGTWGKPSATYTAKAAIERGAADLECYIDGNVSKGDVSFSGGLVDDASFAVELGINFGNLPSGTATGLTAVVEDLTPQLGGNLDMNGFTMGGNTEAQLDDAVSKKHIAGGDTSLGTQTQGLQMGGNNIAGLGATLQGTDNLSIEIPVGDFFVFKIGTGNTVAIDNVALQPAVLEGASLGISGKQFLNMYAKNIYDDGVLQDTQDDLEVLRAFKGKKKKDGSPDISENSGFEYIDMTAVPEHLTNIKELRKELKRGDKALTDAEIDEGLKNHGKYNKLIRRNVGSMLDLTSGGLRQLDVEVRAMFEEMEDRIKALETAQK